MTFHVQSLILLIETVQDPFQAFLSVLSAHSAGALIEGSAPGALCAARRNHYDP